MRISDWSSDVCSSDLRSRGSFDGYPGHTLDRGRYAGCAKQERAGGCRRGMGVECSRRSDQGRHRNLRPGDERVVYRGGGVPRGSVGLTPSSKVINKVSARCLRTEEHTSEPQSLMRISYAVFCLKKKID